MNKSQTADKNYLEERAKFAKEIGQPDLFSFIDHFALYAGKQTLARHLAVFELFRSTLNVPGHVMEFGCWKGANLLFLAKMLSVMSGNSPKLVYGFDSFEGLQTFTGNDRMSESQVAALTGSYQGVQNIIERALELYDLTSTVSLVVGDACKTVPEFFAQNAEIVVSFAYFDFDLYEPTMIALNALHSAMATGGLIVFDEANCSAWPGEGQAQKEFFHSHRGEYAYETIAYARQPTLALRRL